MVFNSGAFGGAAKRYTGLFTHLNRIAPGKFYYIVNNHLFSQITSIFPGISKDNIRIVDYRQAALKEIPSGDSKPAVYNDHTPDPFETDRNTSYIRKIYWYYKNRSRQKKLFHQIDALRAELGIKVFVGVFGGVNPLVFYMNENPKRASVVFSDMDSWFSEVLGDMKKLWYRKYYSFNYALENADYVDFLSPYIVEGVKKRNVLLKEESIAVAPCSFIDYSKCSIGDKQNFQVAFSARLEPDKNPLMFLEAAKIIHAKYPEVKFHLLGEGTLANEIEGYIKQNGLSRAVNFGFHKNPPEILRDTSVFVSLQSATNYPSQSILEAMACGNTIIASDVGDTKLFINNENGILINLSVNELAAAIENLINNKELASKLGANGRDYAMKNHTIEKYTKYFTELINKAYKKNF